MDLQAVILDRLDPLPGAVKRLWSQQCGLPFDQTPEWFGLLYRYVLKDDFEAKTIVVSTSTGVPLSVAPLAVSKTPRLPFGIRKLRSMSNYYTSAFDLIPLQQEVAPGAVQELVSCLARMGSDTDYIELEPVVRDDTLFGRACAAFGQQGYFSVPYRRFANWFHNVEDQTFDEYLQSRESSLRNTYLRKEKRLQKRGYELRIASRPSEVEAAIAEYNEVYSRSWKIAESHPRFIKEVCRLFAERGWLRLGVLRVDGAPVAAQIWFVKDGIASIFKLSYKEQFKALSAGTILSMALLRHVIDIDKVVKIDYLTGDDAYKSQYMSQSREIWGLRAYRKSSLAGLFGAWEISKSALGHRLRSFK